MVYIILNFLVLHFGENFMKIWTKVAKLHMHENLHIMWIKTCFIRIFIHIILSFFEWYLKQYLISMVFNQFEIDV